MQIGKLQIMKYLIKLTRHLKGHFLVLFIVILSVISMALVIFFLFSTKLIFTQYNSQLSYSTPRFSQKSLVMGNDSDFIAKLPNQVQLEAPLTCNKKSGKKVNHQSNNYLDLGLSPQRKTMMADVTNYGERFLTDVTGKILTNDPLIVLHETVISAKTAIGFFQTQHLNNANQASYHALIDHKGTIIYIVPPEKRAFGAANSIFKSSLGEESVQTNPKLPSSVNNFSYHISLESPISGENDHEKHSGYTEAQYYSLAWLIYQFKIPDERITTHRFVDRTGKRKDPRSFSNETLLKLLHSLKKECSSSIAAGSELNSKLNNVLSPG